MRRYIFLFLLVWKSKEKFQIQKIHNFLSTEILRGLWTDYNSSQKFPGCSQITVRRILQDRQQGILKGVLTVAGELTALDLWPPDLNGLDLTDPWWAVSHKGTSYWEVFRSDHQVSLIMGMARALCMREGLIYTSSKASTVYKHTMKAGY